MDVTKIEGARQFSNNFSTSNVIKICQAFSSYYMHHWDRCTNKVILTDVLQGRKCAQNKTHNGGFLCVRKG
jgi:hypothetical protein